MASRRYYHRVEIIRHFRNNDAPEPADLNRTSSARVTVPPTIAGGVYDISVFGVIAARRSTTTTTGDHHSRVIILKTVRVSNDLPLTERRSIR